MNTIGNLLSLHSIRTFAVMVIMALAVGNAVQAAAGPTKIYTLTMNVTAPGPDTGGLTLVTATIKNQSPPSEGSSNISSFTVSLTSTTGMKIVSFDQPSSGDVTIAPDGSSASVTNMSPLKGQKSFVLPLHVSGCGDGGTWGATVWTGSNLSGSNFNPDPKNPSSSATNVACGTADCSATQFTVVQNGETLAGLRGPFNTDGTSCSTVSYFVTNTIPTDETVKLRWAVQQPAAFCYNVTEPFTAEGTDVAWVVNSQGPVFVPAQACDDKNPNLPGPYGSLIQDNNGKIRVNTSTPYYSVPTVFPFRIVIESEVLLVTKINGDTWFVDRGQLKTQKVTHAANKAVMSTPFPSLPSGLPAGYVAGSQARMCIAPATTCSTSLSGLAVIDGDPGGNGYVKPGF